MLPRVPTVEDALELFKKKQFRDAIKLYDDIILKTKDESNCRYRGDAYFALGEYEAAQKDYEKAIKASYINEPYLELGKVLFKQGKYEEALKQFKKAESFLPEHFKSNRAAIMGQVYCYQRLAMYSELMALYLKINKNSPEYFLDVENAQAQSYFSEGVGAKPGFYSFLQVAGGYHDTKARIHYAQIKARDLSGKNYSPPDFDLPADTNPSERLCLLALHKPTGKNDEARNVLKMIMVEENLRTLPEYLLVDFIEAYYKLRPEIRDVEKDEEKVAEPKVQHAGTLKEFQLLKNQYLQFAINTAYHHYLAYIDSLKTDSPDLGRLKRVIEFCDKALMVNPNDGQACSLIAKAYLFQENYKKAHEYYQRMLTDLSWKSKDQKTTDAFVTVAEALSKPIVDEVKSDADSDQTVADAQELLNAANILIEERRHGLFKRPFSYLSSDALFRVLIVVITKLDPLTASENEKTKRIEEALTYKGISVGTGVLTFLMKNECVRKHIKEHCEKLYSLLRPFIGGVVEKNRELGAMEENNADMGVNNITRLDQ